MRVSPFRVSIGRDVRMALYAGSDYASGCPAPLDRVAVCHAPVYRMAAADQSLLGVLTSRFSTVCMTTLACLHLRYP
jgi:hypothetical protein